MALNLIGLHYESPVKSSPPGEVGCAEACDVGEEQAAQLYPYLLPLLEVVSQHVPSIARYLLASLVWLWPLGILFLLPIAFVALLYFTALTIQLYRLRKWLFGRS